MATHIPLTDVILRHEGAELVRVSLGLGEYVIGRGAEADIRAETGLLSRRHARLTIGPDQLLLEDLASSNGTFISGKPLTEATRLFPNQSIQLGPDITLEIRRQRATVMPDASLAPAQAAIRRHLPEELLAERRYAIGGVVARGGMGAILDARQSAIDRTVAMKVMLATGDEGDVLRFIDEAKITGQLEHPNIVPIYELGLDEHGQLFYTMKMVRGITLKKVLELLAAGTAATEKKFPLPALLTIFQKVCDALAFAHAKGVIHRDLKPENIMLGDFGNVLVMDWGLAKVLGKTDAHGPAARSVVLSARTAEPAHASTLAGSIMGTPQYMSPEQARGEVETLDARSDLYALGTILFEILHLRPVITGRTAMEIVVKVQSGEVDWMSASAKSLKRKTDPPASLLAICRKTLAFDPAARYARVEELQADLLAYQTGFATSAEKAGLAKHLALWARRHKVETLATTLVIVLGLGFGTKAVVEGRRANRALAELRKTAPTFFEQAKFLTERDKLPEALEKIDIALTLQPEASSFHAERGNILQSLERFPESADAYAAALRFNPQEAHAGANLELSHALAAGKGHEGKLSYSARAQWIDALSHQGRASEAILAGRSFALDVVKMLPAWQAKVDAWLGNGAPKIQMFEGFYRLDLSGLGITDLSPLRGMPLRGLVLDRNTHVSDLSPLRDCPLVVFSAVDVPDLVDLSPLKGKQLGGLIISQTGVHTLEPLAELESLGELQIRNTAISDLTPIRKSRLTYLDGYRSGISNLEPLRGHPLIYLNLGPAPIASLSPIGDAPLQSLQVIDCGHLDLAHLRTRTLRSLNATGTAFDHPEVLAEMSDLTSIVLPTNLSDPSVLRKLPRLRKIETKFHGQPDHEFQEATAFWQEYDELKEAKANRGNNLAQARAAVSALGLVADQTKLTQRWGVFIELNGQSIADVTPLRSLPVECLGLGNTKVTNLEPLRGMKLKGLCFDGTTVKDVSPLLEMPNLEWALVNKEATNLEVLRKHPMLKRLGWTSEDWVDEELGPKLTAAEFWARYDALKAADKR